MSQKYILVTGSNGFIGKNLIINLEANNKFHILTHKRNDSLKNLKEKINKSSIIIHCAAEIKSKKKLKFHENNIGLTSKILEVLNETNLEKKIIYLSTKQVIKKNDYGITKKKTEKLFKSIKNKKIKYQILRLPNIYGKFAKVNHNSVVANYCYNIARNKKIYVSNYKNKVNLLYIDDLISIILGYIKFPKKFSNRIVTLKKHYSISLKDLIEIINKFKTDCKKNHTPVFKEEFISNLYTTYVSYLPQYKRKSSVKFLNDSRGSFAEILKNKIFGQISLLKINAKEIRGNHFHNSKIEKFYIINGKAEFKLRNLDKETDETFLLDSKNNVLFEMPPGHLHSVKNIGKKDLIILIWSSQIYDKKKPDTYILKK